MTSDLGCCSWSVDRTDVVLALERIGSELQVRNAQIGFFTSAALQQADVGNIRRAAESSRVHIVGVFVGFDGEDYTSIARLGETGGFASDDAYPARREAFQRAVTIAAALGGGHITVHAGTIPAPPHSPIYHRLVERVREAAAAAAERGLRLLLESGREPADRLLGFLNNLDRANLGVNFDAGNFVLYGTDDPVSAIPKLKGRIECVHLKDAVRSPKPGIEYGRSTPLGAGDANIPRVLSKLRAAGYSGPHLIELSADLASAQGLQNAVTFLRSMLE